MTRELLDRSPCSNASRREKEGGDDPWKIEWFHGEVTRAIWRPAKELPRIKSVRILPEASNRGIRERGQRLKGREREKEEERNTQINQPFRFTTLGEKKHSFRCVTDVKPKNESCFCRVSRILVFDGDQARNWECLL